MCHSFFLRVCVLFLVRTSDFVDCTIFCIFAIEKGLTAGPICWGSEFTWFPTKQTLMFRSVCFTHEDTLFDATKLNKCLACAWFKILLRKRHWPECSFRKETSLLHVPLEPWIACGYECYQTPFVLFRQLLFTLSFLVINICVGERWVMHWPGNFPMVWQYLQHF